jgi:hypothetical protein
MDQNSNIDFGSKPKFVMCFICGREFSKASLEIHYYQCLKKAENENNKTIETPFEILAFFDKIKGSKNISYGEIEDFNNFSNNLYKEKTLCSCPFCNRKFLKDRLEVHLRSCKPNEEKDKLKNNNNNRNSFNETGNNKINLNNKKSLNQNLIKDLNSNKIINNRNSIDLNYSSNNNNNNNINDNIISKNYKEQICTNCGENMDINKITLHLKKCNGRKKSQNKFHSKSNSSTISTSNSSTLKSTNFNNNNININNELQKIKISDEKDDKNTTGSDKMRRTSTSNFLICYICGREYGTKSLEIHLKTCKLKFLNNEGIDPNSKNARNSLPNPPENIEEILEKCSIGESIGSNLLENFNKNSQKIYNEISLKKCLGCNRTFNKEALEVHLRSCKNGQVAKEKEDNSHMKITQRPRMLICPLCGREFGSLSLDIHIKSCNKKFDNEQINLPLKLRRSAKVILDKYYENKRKSELQAMEENTNYAKGKGLYNIDEINDQAYEVFSKEALVPCEICCRTFLPDRLLVHLRSCKPKVKK